MVIEVKQNGKFVKIPYITADVPVSEAPIDGKQYARQDATWSEIVIPEVDLTEVEANIAANTQAIAANTADIATLNSTVSNLPTAGSIVVTTDPRLTVATTTKAGLMSAADKVQLDSTLTATEIENKVNAAVSSVYRVKGNVATVSNLPTSNVAIGDVYNITDSGANYVAVNNNPVEWDKLSETVDLAPYMQTSTANSTFVKKAGDTVAGSLIVDESLTIKQRNATGGVSRGIFIKSHDNIPQFAFASFNQNNNPEYAYIGWGSDPWTKTKNLAVSDSLFTYKNIPVALQDDSKSITERYTAGSTERAIFLSHGLDIIPPTTKTNKGLRYYTSDGTTMVGAIGATFGGTTLDKLYMGWGTNPYDSANNLSVSSTAVLYKNNKVWHAGNDGAGSGLDADLLDGKQSINYAHYGAFSSNNPNEIGTSNSSVAGFQTIFANDSNTNFLPKWESGCLIYGATLNGRPCQIYGTYENNRWFARGAGTVASGFTSWREFAMVDNFPVLTQAEYDALGSKVNSDNKIYFIKE